MATTNAFSELARNLASSKLSAGAIQKNLSNRIAAQAYRPRAAAPVADNAPVTPLVSAAATATPAAIARPAAPVAPPVSAFAALKRTGNRAPIRPTRSTTVAADIAAVRASPRPAPAVAPAVSVKPTTHSRFQVMDFSDDTDPNEGQFDEFDAPAPRPKIQHSDEQMAVIECNDKLIVVDAFAGCAKTTTAIGYAAHRPTERMLYLCLNKANAEEAKSRFGANVTSATTHSVAWTAMKPDRDRIAKSWKPIVLMDQMRLNSPREAMFTMRILADFMNSADTEISEKHAEQVAYERDLTSAEINMGVALASLAWKRMNDPTDKLQMPHDAYLKMFALRAPQLNYGTIIFDEAQDANPVTLQIVNGQRASKILCIGDRHQSIYQFRGSVNAMEKLSVGATRMNLTQTWRFGPGIANLANTILGELKGEKAKIKGMGADAPWNDKQVTTLSRTNAELFRIASEVRGEGVHWVGGSKNYRLDLVMDAYHLFIRERSLIQDDIMRRKFASWAEYSQYGEDAGDGEARVLVKVIEEFTNGIPQLVDDIRKNEVEHSKDADITLTTGHRSKGLEYDFVRISNDFEVLEEAENILANHPEADFPEQDINLLYVMLTRARKAVALNDETIAWLNNLPKHRSDREAAGMRQQARLNEQRAAMQSLRAA